MSLSSENRFRSNSFTQIEDAIKKTPPYNTIISKKSAWEQFSQFLVERKYELEEDTSPEDLAKVLEDYGYKYEKEKGFAVPESKTEAVPELIRLLNDEDEVVVSQAASVVLQLAKKDVSAITSQLIRALIGAFSKSNDETVSKAAVVSLYKLLHSGERLLNLVLNQDIAILVKLLSSATESVLFYAVTTLHTLLQKEDSVKTAVKLVGVLPDIVAMLKKSDNAKFLTIVMDCLKILAYGDEASKLTILAAQGPKQLVRIMKTYECENLLWTTSKVLRVLSACPANNKLAIIEAGGVQVLAEHLGPSSSRRLVHHCLAALRNLSDVATKLTEEMAPLLASLVQLIIQSADKTLVVYALEILCNLTCNNRLNKEIIVGQMDGVSALIGAVLSSEGRQEIEEPAVCALKHLTNGHEAVEVARNQVRNFSGITPIVCLLDAPFRWSLVKAATGLIQNLALCRDNSEALREARTVNHLTQLSIAAFDNVDIIKGALDALQILAARDSRNRLEIRQNADFVAILVRLLDKDAAQRATLKLLSKLAVDDVLEGATAPLTRLAHSEDEDIAKQAAALLFRISGVQPQHCETSSVSMEQQVSNSASLDFQDDMLIPAFIYDLDDNYYQEQVDLMQELERGGLSLELETNEIGSSVDFGQNL